MNTPGSGRVSLMNQALDAAFTARALLAPGDNGLVLAGLPPDLTPVSDRWAAVLDAAQQAPPGQARIALAAAITQLPCWGLDEAAAGPPAARDAGAVQEGWYRQLRYLCATGPHLAIRQMMESLAGSPSWNTGVDFGALLAALAPQADAVVRTLYDRAGLDLATDLALVSESPRVEPDPAGVEYARESAFDDTLVRPLLFMTKTGDPLSPASNSGPLEAGARQAGAHGLLRMCYVQAPGHGPFTRAETGAALTVLTERIQDGTWPSILPEIMNLRGRYLDPSPARFTSHDPGPGYRPFYAYSDYPGQSRTHRTPQPLQRWRWIRGAPEGYLRRTPHHLAIDGWRAKQTWRARLGLLAASEAAPDMADAVDQRDRVVRLLQQLPPRQCRPAGPGQPGPGWSAGTAASCRRPRDGT
jgi:hypothetical protein